MREKAKGIIPFSFTLPQIVKKALRSTTPFEELWSSDKTRVLQYIKKHDLDFRVFGERGFDILENAFFVFEYELIDEECKKSRKDFSDFDSFYQYVRGEIYEESCFYGYQFQKKEIDKYSIDCSRINYESFTEARVKTCDEMQKTKEQNRSNATNLKEIIAEHIDSVDSILSNKQFRSAWKQFELALFSLIPPNLTERVFFSLIIQKFGNSVKEYVISHIASDSTSVLSLRDVFFFFGKEAADELIQESRPLSYASFVSQIYNTLNLDIGPHEAWKEYKQYSDYSHQSYRYNDLKNKLKDVLDDSNHIVKKGGFNNVVDLYFVSYDVYYKDNLIRANIFNRYFMSFDDLAKELDGTLSNCDFTYAPITKKEISKYKTDHTTLFPLSYNYSSCIIDKQYRDGYFSISTTYYNEKGAKIDQDKSAQFKWFFDFVHYLGGDLSDADLIMCDGIENIAELPGLKLDGVKVRSEAAKRLNLTLNLAPIISQEPVSLEQVEGSEIETDLVSQTMHETEGDYERSIAYLTDLHLLHRFTANHCETYEDRQYVLRKICRTIKNDSSCVSLLGGDISSDFSVFQSFVSTLATYRNPDQLIHTQFFFTIGNHELWAFPNDDLSEIVLKYRSVLQENGMYLVQNNLYYFSCEWSWKEIPADELECISEKELREKTRGAFLIIFGGMGFAGNNTTFNANQGIYRSAVNREQEIRECEKFNELHRKVSRALYDKNVIVFTHMPIDDWLLDQKTTDRFVYVNGHRHINTYFDDGIKRIYSDNQIGYKRKEVSLKHFSINMEYNWFSDYPDGIHEITAEDYRFFYRGINQGIDFNREFSKIYVLKREQTYLFVAEKENGKRFLLMGGHIKTLNPSSLEYYYEKMLNYSESVRLFVSDYFAYQKRIAEEVKKIGGEGFIHGCIVDIDFFNHLYINPLDGKITPYNALSMVDKILYKNLPSLLKAQRPNLYLNYAKAIQGDSGNQPLPILRKNNQVSDKTVYEPSTEMYRASRILKKLQTLVEKKVIQIWNDEMAGTPSKEIGKTITQGLLESVADKK